jgi:hypothetical protein
MRGIPVLVAAAALAGSVASLPATAGMLTFSYGGVHTGDTPASSAPWLTATFDDSPAAGVLLTLTASLEQATEFITTVKFNLDPALDATLLSFSGSTATGAALPGTTTDTNGIMGQGLRFDFAFDFQTAAGPGRFAGTDQFQTLILYNSGSLALDVSDFQVLSQAMGQNIPRYSLAHVQGIAPNGSGWIFGEPRNGVPEPGVLALLGIAFVGLFAASRRRTRD